MEEKLKKKRKKEYKPIGIFIQMPNGEILDIKEYTPKMHRKYLKSIGEKDEPN